MAAFRATPGCSIRVPIGLEAQRRCVHEHRGRRVRNTPGFHPECVPFLARERDILGVGVETVGTDAGQAATFNPMFPCHTLMHWREPASDSASLTCNLDQLPPTGAGQVRSRRRSRS